MIITIASFKGGVGKTTTALHLAAYLHTKGTTLLADGDLNRSALDWARRGKLPFKVVDERQAVKFAREYEHIVIDTPARPTPEELKVLAEGCDLLILPTAPDALPLRATLEMVEAMRSLKTNYRILLTLVPPHPSKDGEDARRAIAHANLPLFATNIKRLAIFKRAALEGTTVDQIKDGYAAGAWSCYAAVGAEIL